MDFSRSEALVFDASSSSEASSCEEVILASERPKKRAGRRIFKETRHPVYRGVRRRNNNKWVCEVRVPNAKSRIWLGTYSTPEMAARAHDVAALALRGKSACVNFADSAWRLPLPASTDANDIRRAAAQAAEEFGKVTDDYEVCSSPNVNEDSKNIRDYESMSVSDFDHQLHDLMLSMADEPLRSPPPFAHHGSRGWTADVEFDAEVSLWQF